MLKNCRIETGTVSSILEMYGLDRDVCDGKMDIRDRGTNSPLSLKLE